MPKNRKKGSLIVEFLVIIPVFLLLAWGTLHIMFFVMAQSTLHQAAMDAARIVSTELRGHQGPISSTSADTQTLIKEKMSAKIEHITRFNATLLLYRGEDYEYLDPSAVPIIVEPGDECLAAMESTTEPRAICIYTASKGAGQGSTLNQEQIVVKIKANFRIFGNMIPGLEGKLFVRGTGSAIKEQADRFQYITP